MKKEMRNLIRLLPLLSTTTKSLARSTSTLFQPSLYQSPSYRSRDRLSHPNYLPSFPTTTTSVRLFARMPRNVKKENLPSKVCVVCNRPFTWRKKWEKVWDEVTTCSKSCNKKRRSVKQKENRASSNFGEQLSESLQQQQQQQQQPEETTIAVAAATTTTNHARDEEDEISALFDGSTTNFDELLLPPQTTHSITDDENDTNGKNEISDYDIIKQAKIERKQAKKQKKAERRAAREGRGNPSDGQKNCDVCSSSVDLLIRCTIDERAQWKMVCGRCWKGVSGGVVDGDEAHPYYRYGGLWKNRRAVVPK